MLEQSQRDQTIYRWGAWAWYYRSLALMVYGTGIFVIGGGYFVARDVAQRPAWDTILIATLWLLLIAMYALWVLVTWLNGQRRVVSITYSADEARLRVRTLNFGWRRVPMSAITSVAYEQWEQHVNQFSQMQNYYLPKVVIQVRDEQPLFIDMSARIFDAEAFKTLFGFDKDQPLVMRGPLRKKTRGRIVRS